MIREIKRAIAMVGTATLCSLVAGCEKGSDSEPSQYVAGADPAAPFSIVEPTPGQNVSSSAITLVGVGLRDVAGFTVRVYTDRWYTQTGSYQGSSNNSWVYSPVHLGGKDQYNNHTIEAIVIHTDGTTERSSVSGIRRD